MNTDLVLIFDFGSQFAQLIARRVRELNVFCQIVRHDLPAERVKALNPKGIILSGGPMSVYEPGAPHCDPAIFDLGVPVLGICYGMQLMCYFMGGKVAFCCEKCQAKWNSLDDNGKKIAFDAVKK